MRRALVIFFLLFLPVLALAQLRRDEVTIEFKYSVGIYSAYVQRGDQASKVKVLLEDNHQIDLLAKSASLYDAEQSRKAYDLILAPLAHILRRGDKIYFSPAGQLHFINLAALTDKQGRRCFESYQFYRVSDIEKRVKDEPLPSGYVLLLYGGMNYLAEPDLMNYYAWPYHTDERQHFVADCEGLGVSGIDFGRAEDGTRAGYNNLNSSREEIKFIFQLRKVFTRVNTGPEALEECFRMDTRRDHPYVMHVSTHSFQTAAPSQQKTFKMTDEEVSYKSCGLLFSGAGHTLQGEELPYGLNDGLLYAEEIADLDMHCCELMVVGACNTALGRVSQDGVIGLQSAFKRAGAKTLLLTLWSVNDRATSFFMQQFYTYLEKGKTKYDSFNRARQDMIKSKDFSDPVYWAPFILLD